MARIQRIRGYELDGTTITMVIGRTQFDILKCSYGDKLSPEKLRQMGRQDIDSITRGTYDTDDGKFSVAASVFRGELAPLLDVEGFGNRVIPVIFCFNHPELGNDSDLMEARIISLSGSGENSSKPNENELGLIIRQIWWTNERKTINDLGDFPNSLGLSRL